MRVERLFRRVEWKARGAWEENVKWRRSFTSAGLKLRNEKGASYGVRLEAMKNDQCLEKAGLGFFCRIGEVDELPAYESGLSGALLAYFEPVTATAEQRDS